MMKPNARAHLRLVRTSISTDTAPGPVPHQTSAALSALIKSVYLPFSEETLYLRMETCVCGGAQLFYVKLVHLRHLEDHKPVFTIKGDIAEEIVLSHHVEYKKLHRFFGISPVKLVFKHILKLRRKLLVRDMRLEQSVRVKEFFEDALKI